MYILLTVNLLCVGVQKIIRYLIVLTIFEQKI